MTAVFPEICELCIKSLREISVEEKDEVDSQTLRLFISKLQGQFKEEVILHRDKNKELLKLMLEILANGLLTPDSETLLSTSLCVLAESVLNLEERNDFFSECILTKNALTVSLDILSNIKLFIKDEELYYVCLSYAVLQYFDVQSLPKFFTSKSQFSEPPFIIVFNVIEKSCMKYSKLTLYSFKLLSIWLRRLNNVYFLKLTEDSLVENYLKKIFFIVNNNWESPISGVRERNVETMKLMFDILPGSNIDKINLLSLPYFVETVVLQIPWRMKCKYLILSAILPKFGMKKALDKFSCIPNGLLFSLSFPHLASTGTDLYRELLKEISINEWLKFFLQPIKSLIFGSNGLSKQNLMSHWMPETLKAFPSVMNELLPILMCDILPSTLIPLLALLKIGRKRGMLKWEQMDVELILACISQLSEEVRIEVFALICTSTTTSLFPTQAETNMVCTFLEENITADSPRLRQVMLCSFKNFITRLRDVCYRTRNTVTSCTDFKSQFKKMIDFIHWLQNFIICCNEPGVNYQRRISSLHLLSIILDSYSQKSKGNINNSNESYDILLHKEIDDCFKCNTFLTLLLRCLLDPGIDVKDITSHILKKHFKLESKDQFSILWEKALSKCNSSMFYEIESGAYLADVLAHWKLCSQDPEISRMSFNFVEVMLSHAEGQKINLEENLLNGAMKSPVHGVLNALHRMICSPVILMCLKMEKSQINRLLDLVENLAKYIISILSSKLSTKINVAPSFAEMREAIDCTILKNAEKLEDVEIEKINSAHELVLNCIWLNLKMCCLIASALAATFNDGKGCSESLNEDGVEKCAKLLIFILMKCRHKGVIESAGKALSLLVSFCAKNANKKLKNMPMKLLNECLEEIVTKGENLERASITRRSAGLTILVHKLVAANSKDTVPICVPKLLSWTEISDMTSFNYTETEDLPQTQALHFLKVIVEDPAIYQHISPYMSDIALACFKSFSSSIWAIRNGALQLFGSVVSKLVGQKKMQEEDIVGSNVTVEEIASHFPELIDYLLKELESSVIKLSHESAYISPTLMPILAFCSRLSTGILPMQWSSLKKLLFRFQSLFFKLLSSSIIAVRKSSAKAISAFTPLTHLPAQILLLIESFVKDRPKTENELHGRLICINILRDRLEIDAHLIPELTDKFHEVQMRIEEMEFGNTSEKYSFFSRALLYEIKRGTDQDINSVIQFTKNLQSCWYPGIELWASVSIEFIILSCPEENICNIIQECLLNNHILLESSLKSLLKRVKLNALNEFNQIVILTKLVDLCDSDLPLHVMQHCLKSIFYLSNGKVPCISIPKLQALYSKFIEGSNYGIGCSAIALPVISSLIMRNEEVKNPCNLSVEVARTIYERSAPTYSEDFRIQAGKALMFTRHLFTQARDDNKENGNFQIKDILLYLLNSTILLLQDENGDVRKEAAKFVSLFSAPKHAQLQITFNPQCCMKMIFTDILPLLPQKVAVEFLWQIVLPQYSITELGNSMDSMLIKNPFVHGISNIYFENVKTTQMAAEKLIGLIQTGLYDLEDLQNFIDVNITKIFEDANTMISLLSTKDADELFMQLEVYLSLIKVKFQLSIAVAVRKENVEELQLILSKLNQIHEQYNLYKK